MKKLFKQYIPHALMVVCVILCLCTIVGKIGFSSAFMDPVSTTINKFSITDTYFEIMNSNSEEVMDYNQDVVLYDISGCYSRAEIAGGIQRLHDMGAKVIALDVIFGPNSMDTVANDSLVRVISRCKNVIAACRMVPTYDSFRKEESFFVKETGCVEACVNVENETVRNFNKTLTFGDTTLSTYVHEIVKMAYPDAYEKWEAREVDTELINYKRMFFDKIHIYDNPFPEEVKGRIFLMGDFKDLRDFHEIPVKIDGSRRICGTTIHGYSISTLTKPDRLIDNMTDTHALILGLVVTFLFCVIYCWLNEEYNDFSGFLATSTQIVLVIFLLFIGGYLFMEKQYNVRLVYALLGTGMGGYSGEIFYFLYLKWRKRKGLSTTDMSDTTIYKKEKK
jgi:CHASE2 domain-containing sensor protein